MNVADIAGNMSISPLFLSKIIPLELGIGVALGSENMDPA